MCIKPQQHQYINWNEKKTTKKQPYEPIYCE